MDAIEVRITLRPADIKPDENAQVRVTTRYRGMVYEREEILKQNMVTTLFDRLIFRARMEIKRVLQEVLEDTDLESL